MKVSEIPALLLSIGATYLRCAKDAATMLIRNWLILLASAAAFIIVEEAKHLLAPLGFTGGFILGIIQLILLSYYYSWLSQALDGSKNKTLAFFEFHYPLFSAVINAAFFLFILTFIFQILGENPDMTWLAACAQLAVVVVLNALPEIVYVQRSDGFSVISEAATFTRENWIEWFIPLIAILTPVLLVDPQLLVVLLATGDPLLPPYIVVKSTLYLPSSQLYPLIALAIVLANWFMLFRARLFQELSSGNRRVRMFRAKMS